MNDQTPIFKTSQLEAADAEPRNLSGNPTMGELISVRFSRRGFLKGSLAVSAIAATVSPLALLTAGEAVAGHGCSLQHGRAKARPYSRPATSSQVVAGGEQVMRWQT